MQFVSVLLVDDNPDFLKLTAEFLRRYDDIHIVGCANGGKRGVVLAQELKPDVVVIDLDMPDLAGLQAMPILRHQLPGTGIIGLTVFDSRYYYNGALSAGADAFVSKGELDKNLAVVIRRLADIRKRRPVS